MTLVLSREVPLGSRLSRSDIAGLAADKLRQLGEASIAAYEADLRGWFSLNAPHATKESVNAVVEMLVRQFRRLMFGDPDEPEPVGIVGGNQ